MNWFDFFTELEIMVVNALSHGRSWLHVARISILDCKLRLNYVPLLKSYLFLPAPLTIVHN